jgi:formylglycine-generating enzyme required for sulfatase activity
MKSTQCWTKSSLLFSLSFFLSIGLFGLGGCTSKEETTEATHYIEWSFDADEALRRQEEKAGSLSIPVEFENSTGMKFRLIPAGEFMMGNPVDEKEEVDIDQLHQVRLTRPYYISIYETTQEEYEDVMGKNPSAHDVHRTKFDVSRNPVEMVTWKDAEEFCEILSARDGLNYRLPTEAEWEYACRAGTEEARYGKLDEIAWHDENCFIESPSSNIIKGTHPVGEKLPNAFGLYDMLGNVEEWCNDLFEDEYYAVSPVRGPTGPTVGDSNVLRGSSWGNPNQRISDPMRCRSSDRSAGMTGAASHEIGFRVACSVELGEEYPAPAVTSEDEESVYTEWPFDADEALHRQKENAEMLDISIKYINEIGMIFHLIPAGEFMMGSPEDEEFRNDHESLHQVEIAKPFYLGVCEVTQGEWEAVMGTTPWSGQTYTTDGTNYPATYVNWEDVQEFCHRLSARDGMCYRLPTEAEWEYACRAGTATAYCFGDSGLDLGEYAWYRDNTWDCDQQHPSKVGGKQANAWGLHDMYGNVGEWCQDCYDGDYNGSETVYPRAPIPFPLIRGDGWGGSMSGCRSANRNMAPPNDRSDGLGFRVTCSVEVGE